MVKVLALSVFHKTPAATTELASAFDLSQFGFFQRGTIQEFMKFFSKTCAQKNTNPMAQLEHTQDTQKVMCFVVASQSGPAVASIRPVSFHADTLPGDGFVATALTDAEYPRRAALSMCTSILQEFGIKFPTARAPVAWPQLDQYLVRYQDPTEADKLAKIQKDLDETKVILHKTIDEILVRGERLDDLVDRTADLSSQSKQFYKVAKSHNSCCSLM